MTQNVPESVAIVAMGESFKTYAQMVVNAGNRKRVAQETWAINSVSAAFHHDRLFLMDDIEADLRMKARERPGIMVAGLLEWLASHPGPIYTSVPYDTIPGSVAYPLEAVLNSFPCPYLNTTVAYALAFAIHLGVPSIGLYGCDFTYSNRHIAESGRACVEHLLGLACTRGISVTLPDSTTLFDACVPAPEKFYGYRYVGGVHLTRDPETKRVQVTFGKDIKPDDGEAEADDGGAARGVRSGQDRGSAGAGSAAADSIEAGGGGRNGTADSGENQRDGSSDIRAFRGNDSEEVHAAGAPAQGKRR